MAYYQQVGRAGRALAAAYGVLLSGEEETEITDYFIESAFPTRDEVQDVLDALLAAPNGLSVPELMGRINLSMGRIQKTIDLLSLESPAPIAKQGSKWQLTVANLSEAFWARADRLTALRRDEQRQMQQYVSLRSGHMKFLIRARRQSRYGTCPRITCAADDHRPDVGARGHCVSASDESAHRAACEMASGGHAAVSPQGKHCGRTSGTDRQGALYLG